MSGADKKYQSITDQFLEHIPCAVFAKDLNSRFISANQFLAVAAGFKDGSEMVGKSDYEMPWADELVNYHEIDREVMQCGEVIDKVEPIQLKNKKIIARTMKAPLYEEGKVIGVVGAFIDITDLIELKEKAEVANKAKEQFLYNMRHDIRTPFSGILGVATLLKNLEKDAKKLEYIDAIQVSSERLLDYLNEILEFTQVEDGNIPVVSQRLFLKDVAQTCVDMHFPALQERKLEFLFTYDDALPEVLLTDDFRIKRILINLLGNAIKFTPSGAVKLKVNLARDYPESQEIIVSFSVEDTGIGIPLEKQSVIFEKFERLSASYEGKYKGSGLGLFTVKKLVNELNGEVQLISRVGQGSTFICTIPMKKAGMSSYQLINASVMPVSKEGYSGSAKILLVEDDSLVQMVVSSIFEGLNSQVDAANTGEQALEYFEKNQYDFVLMDIGLPDMDGYEVAHAIRAIEKSNARVPIVALTAHAKEDVQSSCSEAGMSAVLSKPLSREQAESLLKEHVPF